MFGDAQKTSSAHILGWNEKKKDWIYNEAMFQQFDRVMAMASEYGVKLIVPIINQDFGDSSTSFVGNFNDLIRHRYKIRSYRSASAKVDWFTQTEIREDFKKIIFKLLTRKNTINGRIYGEDDTILAWETGNEMNWGRNANTIHDRPAPANWTLDIAQFIKYWAPNTLVMDGSYSGNPQEPAWPAEVLNSSLVDIVSYHLYGDSDLKLYSSLSDQANQYNKALVIGEHGFYSSPDVFQEAYELFDCPGALVWSLRGHSDQGGFITHGEGHNIYSYHVPGWPSQSSEQFDTHEEEVVRLTYEASYDILDESPEKFPVPDRCAPFIISNSSHYGISWLGSAWAQHYEVWAVPQEGGKFQRVASQTYDNINSGELFLEIDTAKRRLNFRKATSVGVKSHAGFVNQKFTGRRGQPLPTIQVGTNGRFFKQKVAPRVRRAKRPMKKVEQQPDEQNSPIPQGPAWYAVRPISATGDAGPFSIPLYVNLRSNASWPQ
ncbi:hypothetical protein O181_027943 [Austropuccinia psidii MF-1]|uniref:mannan endo-1,4-beta-mannosidase n=1 Tax=Austropuccinia psidii MF-1 TaxID=1389203 RepID=A0A9Q3H1C9_9BASI|nr:hypothetical protein [Austropuccinia psidii MF-1]